MSNQQEDLALTCPACGLLCDDIRIKQQDGHLDVEAQGCALAQSFFQQSVPSAQAKINDGSQDDRNEGNNKADGQKHPSLSGLAGEAMDINGQSAIKPQQQ